MKPQDGLEAFRRFPDSAYDRERELQRVKGSPLQLGDMLAILRKRAWIVVGSVFLAIVAAVFLLTTETPRYVASAEMLLGGQSGIDRRSSDLLEARAFSASALQGELAILESSALLVRVVRRLGLDQDAEFNPALRPPSEPMPFVDGAKTFVKALLFPPKSARNTGDSPSQAVAEASSARSEMLNGLGGTVGTLRRNMYVRQRGSSYVVAVTLSSADPVKAAGIANALADEYIDFVSDKRFEAAQRFTNWLEMRVEELARRVEDSETAVIAYRSAADAQVDSAARIDQQIKEMTTKLVDARTILAETEARAAKSRDLLENDGILAAASVLTSPILSEYNAQLAKLRRDEGETALRFSQDSAQLEAIRREAFAVSVEIRIEVQRIIEELENKAEVMRINVDALSQSLDQFEQVVLARSKEQIKLNQLERVADANRRLYEDFLGRFKESSEILDLKRADAEVISYASPPGSPATPRKKQTLVLAIAAGLFIGLGIVFLMELLPKRFTSSDQVTRRTGLKVFGHFPRLPRRNSAHQLGQKLVKDPNSDIARSAHSMLRNLELELGRSARSAMVISHASGDDKTTMAIMLGWAAAQRGRSCLLIDADLQNSALSRRFARHHLSPCLLDVLYDDVASEEAVHYDEELGLSVLPTSPTSVDPATLFGTQHMDDVIKSLSETFDFIVIDAPPLDNVADTINLRSGIDIGLYAIRAKSTGIDPVVERMPLFESIRMEIGGSVLSHAEVRRRRSLPTKILLQTS